jgi:hypothetical protein
MVIALIAMVAVVMLVMPFVVSMSFVFAIVMAVIFVTVVLMYHIMSVNVVSVIFYSGMFFMALFPMFVSGMFFMAHFPAFLVPFMSAVRNFVSMVFMLPDIMMLRIVMDSIRMVIFVAVHPCALPRRVIDKDHATVPGNAVISPSPWPI